MLAASGLILLILFGHHGVTHAADTFSIMNDVIDYAEMIKGGDWWGLARKVINTGQPPEDGIPEVMAKLEQIEKKMDEMASMLSEKITEVMRAVISRVPKQVEYDSTVRQLSMYIVRIESLWTTYKGYHVKGTKFNHDTLQDFVRACVSNIGDSLRNTLDQMVALVAPGFTAAIQKSLWEIYDSVISEYTWEERCGKQVTEQYKMFVIHRIIVVEMMKGLQMLVFSYTSTAIWNNRSYNDETNQVVAKFTLNMELLLQRAKVGLSPANREIMSCDPPEHKRDVTYMMMDRLFWAIAIREDHAQMNSGCSLTCSETYFDWKSGMNPTPQYSHIGMPCPGMVDRCSWLGESQVCTTMLKEVYYKWIKSPNGDMGDTDSCPGEVRTVKHSLKAFSSCDVCICTCTSKYADASAARAISLWPLEANIKNNKVIVGVKWYSTAGLLRPQIQIAELGRGGTIVNGTDKWQWPQTLPYNIEASDRGGYNRMDDGKAVPMIRNKDFMFIDEDHRQMNLDDVECEGKYVMTAVKLGCEDEDCQKCQMEIRCTPFDYDTGKVMPDEGDTKSVWITPQTMEVKSPLYKKKRTKIEIHKPEEPSYCKLNTPQSTVNQAVEFDRTYEYTHSCGQHTIPGLEMIPTLSTKSPLSGMGLYYKGGEGCGGLIAFKLIGLNYAKHINPALTKKQMDRYEELAG